MEQQSNKKNSLLLVFVGLVKRFAVFIVLFFLANWIYEQTLYPKERYQFSRVAGKLDSALRQSDIVYLGESSNTSFNPWTDTLGYSVSQWLQYYFDSSVQVTGVSHDGYHVGMFQKMLGLLPDRGKNGKMPTLVVTVNMRSFGPAATFNPNEASNQQEAVFYSHRLPLLNRVYVSLHHYDNRNSLEMEREKFRWWRTHSLGIAIDKLSKESGLHQFENSYTTSKQWFGALSMQNYELPQEIRNMADAYVKEFAWVMNDDNPRLQDLKSLVQQCSEKNVNLVLLLLMPNRAHADSLFGQQLTQYIDYNLEFLRDRIATWQREIEKKRGDCATGSGGLTLVDIPTLYFKNYGYFPSSAHYTDQFFPTEHVDAHVRGFIAAQVANGLGNTYKKSTFSHVDSNVSVFWSLREIQWNGCKIPFYKPVKNNWLNPELTMPTSDSMMGLWRKKP
ncbi:MAG: hypothetical protein ACK448_05150 [Bacteroidota bacterium]|jgi:hypothetical protein